MNNITAALSVLLRIILLITALANLFSSDPDKVFALCCFIMYICVTIERGVEGIRSALEVLVTVKNELDKNKKETT